MHNLSILFIDATVENHQSLLVGIEPSTQVFVLDSEEDGIRQITSVLAKHPDCTDVHVISHGSPGCLHLGQTQLSLDTLNHYAWDLKSWFASSSFAPSLLLYGCNVAAGDAGVEFIEKLQQFTGAKIAASTSPVGHASLRGSWQLDHNLGQIQATLPIASSTLAAYEGVLAAPEISDNITAIRTVDEDQTLSITGISVSDTDTADIQTVTLTVAQGILNLASTNGLSGITGNGTGSISFSGTLSNVNAALAGASYKPGLNYSGNETLSITVNDGTQSASRNLAIAVTPVNDAPTIALSGISIVEGSNGSFTASNFGITDVDNQDVQIIVKLNSLPSKGYLTFNGNFLVVGSTFSYDQIAQLRYVHGGTQTTAPGGTSDAFTITVDDGAGGTIGATTIPVTITPVNQLPTVTGTNTLFEGETNRPVSISISDPDQTASNYTVEILSLPADGILSLNGTPITAGQTLSSADLANLIYSHDGNDDNFGNPPPDGFTVRVTDDGGGTGTPGSITATINLNIRPNNDDPVLVTNTGMTLNTSEGLTKVITPANLSVADPDSATTQLTYTLTAAPDPTIGGLELFRGSTWVRIGVGASFTQDDLNDGRVRYAFHKASSGNQSFADSFSFQVRDSEIREYPSTREGGIWQLDGSGLQTLTFNVSVNVPPTATGGAGGTQNPTVVGNTPPITDLNVGIANLNEGGSTTITSALLRTTDTDNAPSEIVYRITSLPTSGVIQLNGVSLGLYGSFTQADINNNRVTFNHAGNEDFTDNFRFTVSDGTNVTFEQTFPIDITPVNDAPTVTTSGSPFLREADTLIIDNSYLSLGDVDGTGEKSGTGFATPNTLTFQVVTLPTHGVLEVDQGSGFVTVTSSTIITKAQLDSGKLRYVHNGTENFTDSFAVQANDNTGTSNNLSTVKTVNLTIASLNDNPAFASSTPLTVTEAGSSTIKGSNGVAGNEPHLLYTDPDNTTIQRQYRITNAPANGTLFRSGQALSVGSVFTQADLDNSRITYTHNGSENYSDGFNFTVSDGGGAAVPGNYTITVTPTNDAPKLTAPITQIFNTDTPLTFNTANGNRIVVSDVDLDAISPGETDILRVTVDLQAGGATYTGSTLNLGSISGLTITGSNGTPGGTVTFEGTKASVQAALDGLQVQVPTDEDRALSLVVTVNDLNNGGPDPVPLPSGYSTIVTKTITLFTSNDNDAPTIASPAIVTATEDVAFGFTGGNGIAIADVDAFNSTDNTVTLSVSKGTLTLTNTSLITGGANNSSTITLTGSLSAINSALTGLSYKGNSNVNGSDTLTIVANDKGNTGLNNGASDPKITTQTVDINLTPVNDQPTLTAPTAIQTISDTNPKVFSTANGNAITIDDLADLNNNGADNFTVTLNVTDGTLTAASSGASLSGNGTATLTITGTKAQVNTALDGLSYSPSNFNSEQVVNLGITVSDNANGGTAVGGIGGALTTTQNVTINVSNINDPPVITAPLSRTVVEDNSIAFTSANLISINDPDDFGGILEVTLGVTRGILNLGSTTGITFVTGDGTDDATMTFRGTESALNAALSGLRYQGNADFNGPDSLSIQVNDLGNTGGGGSQIVNRTVGITVTPVNDAPTRSTGTTTLAAVVEDNLSPSGSTVTSLFGSLFRDTKDNQTSVGGSAANSLAGIAITTNAATAIQGVWQWSTDGTTWSAIGTPSTASALVLSTNTQVRFVPNANFNGTPGNLTVRLIDDSAGAVTSGTTVNVSISGGTTQYSNSSNTVTLTTSVTAVNDAPIATGTSTLATIDEDTTNPAGDTVTNLFTARFNDSADQVTGGSSANTLIGVAIVGNPVTTEGTWQYFNGTTWQAVGNPSAANALLVSASDKLRFVPAANYNGVVPALSVHLIDSSGGTVTTGTTVNLSGVGATGGTTRYSANTVPLSSAINPVNDAPTFSNLGGSVTFTEDGAGVILDGDAIANDIDLAGLNSWSGATLTLRRQSGANSQDVFANSGTLGTLTEGSTFAVNGVTIGTVTTNTNGTLILTFNGNATTTLVNSSLQQITYRNTSEDPPTSVAIAYTLNDGNTGAQGSGGALTTTGTVTVNITPVNDAPVVSAGAMLAYTENQTGRVIDNTVTVSDVDDTQIASATVTISSGFTAGDVLAAVTTGTNITASYNNSTGVLTLSGTDTLARYQQVMRSVTYLSTSETPTQTANTRTVTWRVTDANSDGAGAANSAPVTSTITINALPDPVNDTFNTNEDTLLNGSVADADAGDGPATYTVISAPSYGVLNFNSDGSFTYTPSPDYNGSDSFTYSVRDANGDTATAIATITVNPVADIANDSSTTKEDTPVKISVLNNDSFAAGATITGVTNGTNGTVVVNTDGTVTYTPKPNFFGSDSFTYTVTSGGRTETATVNVTVDAVPDPTNDTFSISEDVPLSGSVADADAGDGPATYTVTSAPSHGSLNFNLDGSFAYTPNPDFNGTDSFTYQVTDANGDVGTAIATITVNPVTDIADDSRSTDEDTPVVIPVLDNDSFAAGATVTSVTNGSNGTVVINPDGTVTYTPKPDFNGSDSFSYTVTTVAGNTETATVNVTVNPVTDIADDSRTTSENSPAVVPVLDNDSFAAGATVTSVTNGGNGTVVINSDGTVTYTPKPDFNGNDSFSYTVTSGGVTETATVNVTVSPVAEITDDSSSTDEDTPVMIPVLDNDSFAAGATVTSVTDGSNGTVVINSDGTVTYTPKPDFNGSDSFTYTVTTVADNTETATVNVIVNPLTDIADDSSSTDEDTPVMIPVLDNDSFAAGATVTSVTDGSNGTVVINSDGTITYTPKPDFNGSDSFTYTVTSGGVTETATVNVTVNPIADIASDSSSTDEDTPVTISVLANDSFAAGATVTAVTNGSNGSVVINSDGTVTYTPKPDFNGIDSFTYTVTSGGVTETATVNVAVEAVPDPTNDAFITNEDVLVSGSVADADVGDEPATYAVTSAPRNGVLSFNPDGSFIYTPNPDFNGNDAFTYQVTDANGDSATAIATVLIKPIADIANDRRVTQKGKPIIINALANDSFESRNAAIQKITQGRNGTVNINRDGTLTYTPKSNFVGTDRFTYTVKSGGVTETATISIRVSPPPGPNPINGSSGSDVIIGTNGDDILNGFSDVDVLRGLGGNDIINGGSSRDIMRGDSGNDILNGGSGNDDMRGGSGNDILNGGNGHDLMFGGTGNDILNGGLGNDRLYGEAGRDTLDGGDGNDRLYGGLGNDILRGGRGDDLLVGGLGKDTLTGGLGRDQFIYTSIRDFGDVITDFEIVMDRINFRQIQSIQSMSSLRFTQKGNDTLLRANINGNLMTVAVLEDVNANTLSQRHFIF